MNPKILLTITAVIAFIFGLGLLIAPGSIMAPNGLILDHSGILFARSEAAVLIGLALINWFSRNCQDDHTLRGIILGNFASQTIALIVTVTAILAGELNAAGWAPAIMHLLLGVGFGYYTLAKPFSRQPATAM